MCVGVQIGKDYGHQKADFQLLIYQMLKEEKLMLLKTTLIFEGRIEGLFKSEGALYVVTDHHQLYQLTPSSFESNGKIPVETVPHLEH